MGDHKCLRNEEKKYREEPENDVSRAGFYGGAEEIRNNNEQDGGENKIRKSQFLAECGTVLLDRLFGGPQQVGSGGGQSAGAYLRQTVRDTLNN